jgi:hypothetical protein
MLDSTTRMCYDVGGLAKPNLESAMLGHRPAGADGPGHAHAAYRRPYADTPAWGMYELGFLPMRVHCVAVTFE